MAIQKLPQNVGHIDIGGYGSIRVEDQNGITTLTLVDENHTQINEWLLDAAERLELIAMLRKGWEE